MTIAALSVTVCCLLAAVPVAAADREGATIREVATGAVIPMDGDADGALRLIQFGGASRGSALPAPYVSLVAFQVADGYTTTTGLARGASTDASSKHIEVCWTQPKRERDVASRSAVGWIVSFRTAPFIGAIGRVPDPPRSRRRIGLRIQHVPNLLEQRRCRERLTDEGQLRLQHPVSYDGVARVA